MASLTWENVLRRMQGDISGWNGRILIAGTVGSMLVLNMEPVFCFLIAKHKQSMSSAPGKLVLLLP